MKTHTDHSHLNTIVPAKVKVLYTIGLTMFAGGLFIAFLGMKVFDFSHVIGLAITFGSIPVFLIGAKHAPKDSLKNSGGGLPHQHNTDHANRMRTSTAYPFLPRNIHYKN